MHLRNSLLVLVLIFWHWRTDAAGGTTNSKVLNWRVSVANQSQLDQFINNVTAASNDKGTTSNIHLSLDGDNTYTLDIVKLMNINITNSSLIMKSKGGPVEINCTTNSSLIMKSKGGPVEINCTANEKLGEVVQPISRASVVQMDGLVFTGCPVPIMIEEASSVRIQNCVFQ